MTTPEQNDGLEDIWQQAINRLDMHSLPDPPKEYPEYPMVPPEELELEQAKKIWYAEDDVERWWRLIDEMPFVQPDFGPNHIKSPEELRRGMRVIWVIGEERATREMIITETDVDVGSYRGFEAIDVDSWKKRNEKQHLYGEVYSYSGVGLTVNTDWMPKIEGKWATFNHLCRTGDTLSEEEMDELMQLAQERFPSGMRVFGPFKQTDQRQQSWFQKLIARLRPQSE